MPNLRIYPKVPHVTLSSALVDISKFLNNSGTIYTGSVQWNWKVVEAFTSGSLGIGRQVPTSGSILNLTGTVASAWVSGNLQLGDWIVFESENANNTNHFQLYMEYDTISNINFMMIPFEDFVTGGSHISPPLFPTTSFAEGSGTMFGFSIATNAFRYYSVVADEGMMSLVVDTNDAGNAFWTYIGELECPRTSSDPRCYVLWDLESQFFVSNTTNQDGFNRLSPINNSAVLVNGWPVYPFSFETNSSPQEYVSTVSSRGSIAGLDYILPIGVFFNSQSHRHFAGWLRNVYSISSVLGGQGTLNNRQYFYRNTDGSNPAPTLCFSWDGQTRY